MNLPFSVASRAARAYQEREDAKIRAQYGSGADPGKIGVAGATVTPSSEVSAEAVQLDAAQARGWVAQGRKVEFVDVRTAAEVAAGPRVAGAVHMPMDTLNVRVSELSWEVPVVVLCDDGRRSTDAVRFFRERGMEDTWALRGGIAAWAAAGGAVER